MSLRLRLIALPYPNPIFVLYNCCVVLVLLLVCFFEGADVKSGVLCLRENSVFSCMFIVLFCRFIQIFIIFFAGVG